MGGGKEVSDGKMRLVEGLKTRQVAGQTERPAWSV